ncbi:MAG: ABC transporter substrate-binding protein [bacterium]|nr:ABC transporter substrate-binding protein [bacterium]
MTKNCLLILILFVLLPISARAQNTELTYIQEAETLFQRSIAKYIQGKNEEARLGFQELLAQYPPNQRTSAAQLMLAKTHYRLKDYSLAIASAVELQLNFPYSRYLAESDLLIGDCYFQQGQVYSAATQYSRVLTSRTEVRSKARAADRLGQMAGTERLSIRDLERLQSDFGRAAIDEAVAFGQARWPVKLGQPETSQTRLAHFLERYPNSQLAPLAQQSLMPEQVEPVAAGKQGEDALEKPAQEPENARYKIGVIAPFGTPIGEDLRDGILLARELNPLRANEQIGLVFEDSEGDPIRAVRAAQRLIEQHNVIAFIGALTSAETTPLAAYLGGQGVPLIAPTASDDGIASLSSYIFQVNATPGAQGRRLAEYAVRRQGLRMLATLASRDNYGRRIATEFTAKAEELGAEVLIQEWYESGTTDYRRQFERIRSAGLALDPPDDLASEIEALLLHGIHLNPPPPVPVDPDTVQPRVVDSLDGILIVGDDTDILLIAPQFRSALIPAQLLGSDGWNHLEVARDGGNYVDGAVFVSKYYAESSLNSVQEFINAYRSRFGKEQNIVAALGYDAMLATLKAIDAGGHDRMKLRDQLERLTEIPSATGHLSFSKGDRENAWMYLLTIKNKRIEPLESEQKSIGSP